MAIPAEGGSRLGAWSSRVEKNTTWLQHARQLTTTPRAAPFLRSGSNVPVRQTPKHRGNLIALLIWAMTRKIAHVDGTRNFKPKFVMGSKSARLILLGPTHVPLKPRLNQINCFIYGFRRTWLQNLQMSVSIHSCSKEGGEKDFLRSYEARWKTLPSLSTPLQ